MLQKIILKITLFLLKNKRLSGIHRTNLMSAIIVNLNALPVDDVIKYAPDGTIIIRGRKLATEQMAMFAESCMALQDNMARKLFEEQTSFEAIKLGIHNGLNEEMIQFSKAILWWNEQQKRLISLGMGE